MTRHLVLLLAIFLFAPPVWSERPRPLGHAIEAAQRGSWENAARIAARDGAVAGDIIEWMRLRAGRGTFQDIATFLTRRPDWPGEPLLRRRSEAAVIRQGDPVVLDFFADGPPQTPRAVLAHAGALERAGQSGEAAANVVLAWRTIELDSAEREAFLSAHEALLKPHHAARLDHMLWEREGAQARAIFDLVSPELRQLAEARLALQNNARDIEARLKAVPEELADDPGLMRDRYEWLVKRNRWEAAKVLLVDRSRDVKTLGRPEYWARQRRVLARDEMRDGDTARAYQLAAQNFLVEGSDFADLEWLAGYIALRYLKDPELALLHFDNHRSAVRSPISLGRAGYWRGRALADQGDAEAAAAAFAEGGAYQTSFYGLLAAERAGLPADPRLAGDELSDWRGSELAGRDLFEAGLLLQASGQFSLAERFWTHFAELLTQEDIALLGQAAMDVGQPHLAVMIGKRAATRGIVVPAPYYALHPLAEAELPMAREMSLAIARRESEFDPVVQSGVGARGLMQIMPRTGQAVARDLGIDDHTTERLTTDPAYNARLGSTYLSQLAGTFGGNVVMVSAGYNAGPSRPLRWMDRFGDPRGRNEENMVDWIEHIPFRETRNYVMRVTESLPVYRARLGQEALPIPFSQELIGSTLAPFAPESE